MKRLLAPLLMVFATGAFAAPQPNAPAVQLHGKRFTTEFATNNASRERGLMMRTELAADHSMLFVFPEDDQRWFWMKNTLIPLDILYFDGHRKLVSVQANVPPCKADPCPSYPSDLPARYVLELAGGTAAKIGVQVGDELTIEGTVGPVQ
ncbi:DUF192 domain-containing protein [Dyella humicola]|uniref:DUF192 domain-containing protein n=1 Tax=Dyella humicola TaxID=2992126 RepID=UPI0022527655|nr:DUF192 domain-containing protein [Dyella humicola]